MYQYDTYNEYQKAILEVHIKMDLRDFASESKGNVKKLADALGISHSSVSFWISGKRKVPMHHCPKVERLTGVPRRILRPDVDWSEYEVSERI